MAKTKRFFYECVMPCDLPFTAPDNRKEHTTYGTMVMHSIRVMPSPGLDARGRKRPPGYIVTDKPLARHYVEEMAKKVSRPSFDENGRRNGRVYRKKVTKIKFVLLDPEDVDGEIKRMAIDKPWRDTMFEEVSAKVDLPRDTAILDKTEHLGQGDEPVEMVPDDDEPLKPPVRRK